MQTVGVEQSRINKQIVFLEKITARNPASTSSKHIIKKARKDDSVPNVSNNFNSPTPFCTHDHKIQSNEHLKNILLELKNIAPDAAVFTSIQFEDTVFDSEETDTADEEESNCTPEPLSGSFNQEQLTSKSLINYSQKVFSQYKRSYTQKRYSNLCTITKQQSLSEAWKIHRVGRITASISKMAYRTKLDTPSKNF